MCTTDADCVVAAAADWCVTTVTCDAVRGACIAWPRCRGPPWLGCLNATRECVDVAEESPQPQQPLLPTWSLGVVAALVVALVSCALMVALLCLAAMPRRSLPRQQRRQQQEEGTVRKRMRLDANGAS